MNEEYFPDQEGLSEIYADTNPVYVPDGKVITGFQFWKKGNRLAPKLRVSTPEGDEVEWILNEEEMNDNYFPDRGGLSEIYADSNKIQLSTDHKGIQLNQIKGFMFWQKGNRIAPAILV